MTPPPRTIFIFSLEPWGDMWYSKHHYAAHLARTHKVFFVSLPDRWRWTDLFSFRSKVRSTPEGVHVVEYRNNLPFRALSGRLSFLIGRLNALKLRRLMPEGEVLFWSFHPTIMLDGRILRRPGTRTIYHVVDPYQNLPLDSVFARRADLVVAINPWYEDYYRKLNAHCILVPHGVRHEDRGHDPLRVQANKERWGRYAILATGLNHFVNYALLLQVAQRFPDLHLVIVGQFFPVKPALQAVRDRLFALPNVTYAGVKHPDELKDMVRGATMGLLTYDFEPTYRVPVTAGRTPLKALTYLAQLCPVVSTNNSYIPAFEERGYFKAEDAAHFLELVDDVLAGRRTVDAAAVDGYLDGVEYGRLIERILTGLDEAIGARGQGLEPARPAPANLPDTRPVVPAQSPVLIISNEEWDGPRYSKHRYAIALSALRKVYFIDPPDQWRPGHLFSTRIQARPTPEGIVVLAYNNAIPLLGGLLGSINDRIITRRLRTYLREAGDDAPVFWTFDPSRLADPAQLRAVLSVYHCADDHAFRWRGERLLAERCDHVFCIARDLMPRFLALNPSVHHVPHGLAASDMDPSPVDPTELPAAPGYGLYIGNINDRHDFALWEKLFQAHPDVTWVVVGPVQVTDPVGLRLINEQPYPNVIFLPTMPYGRLRTLIAGSGFGFLYMRDDHPANRISSQKVVQFLALGKPFFCSWFSEYADRRALVYMTDDHAEALSGFAQWKGHGEPAWLGEHRIAFAESQQFPKLVGQLPFRL